VLIERQEREPFRQKRPRLDGRSNSPSTLMPNRDVRPYFPLAGWHVWWLRTGKQNATSLGGPTQPLLSFSEDSLHGLQAGLFITCILLHRYASKYEGWRHKSLTPLQGVLLVCLVNKIANLIGCLCSKLC
jgi:hypothetical protein